MTGAELLPKKSDPYALSGKRVLVQALGCRTNIAEGEALMSEFARRGAETADAAPFDVAVVVTCSITSVADRKSRQMINRFRRECPNACVVACGCWAQDVSEKSAEDMGVDLLVGNRHKSEIPSLVSEWLSGHGGHGGGGIFAVRGKLGAQWDGLELDSSPYFGRAFIKVQDGCDHGCTYCIVPKKRGPSVSRPIADIIAEARRCAQAGHFEIILTGVHLGLFGRGTGESLGALVEALGRVDGIKRLRFGSLEPFSIGDDLLEALSASRIFCRHLHLPVQSGDDGILRKMGRGHTAQDFLDLTRRLRSALGDDLHISTDAMCAFPTESESAFRNTLDLLTAARIGRVHGFRYSPRPGTPAAAMRGQVPPDVAADRVRRLCAAGAASLAREAERWVGRRSEVLFEGTSRGHPQGYTPEYLEFRPTAGETYNALKSVEIEYSSGGILFGK